MGYPQMAIIRHEVVQMKKSLISIFKLLKLKLLQYQLVFPSCLINVGYYKAWGSPNYKKYLCFCQINSDLYKTTNVSSWGTKLLIKFSHVFTSVPSLPSLEPSKYIHLYICILLPLKHFLKTHIGSL